MCQSAKVSRKLQQHGPGELKILCSVNRMYSRTTVLLVLCLSADVTLSERNSSVDLAAHPLLFMTLGDVQQTWGRLRAVANPVQRMDGLTSPPENYTAGATVFAAFPLLNSSGMFEVFVAVGRPGEPWIRDAASYARAAAGTSSDDGVKVKRYTTTDFVHYSEPITVLFLPNDSGQNDGSVWTVKSMDRDPSSGRYLLFASYHSQANSFITEGPPTTENCFRPTTGSLKKPNFEDHDDINVFYDGGLGEWVDMQIMYENISVTMAHSYPRKKYCDNMKNDTRRVISYRTSKDGVEWTQDAGCADKPQKGEHCESFHLDGMIRPNPEAGDPPELEFYRMRPFLLGDSGRLAAHTLLYTPAPSEVTSQPGYGRQPMWYCKNGCCHGPHMYEEWWVGPSSGHPSELTGWQRPFYDTWAFPHDVWAMSQPITFNDSHIWVDNGAVFGLLLYRLAGLYTASNAEFSTSSFGMPDKQLWVNANVYWLGGNGVGGCDEGCAAYLMAELRDAQTDAVIPGYEKDKCIIMNKDSLRLPLEWKKSETDEPRTGQELAGNNVQLRLFFRLATIYAVGHF